MKAIYNDQIIPLDAFQLTADNRAFQYGDGIFETLIYENGRILFLEEHYQRMLRGAGVLRLQIPGYLNLDYLKHKIPELIEEHKSCDPGRIKMMLWRKAGGVYKPSDNNAEIMITCSKTEYPAIRICPKVSFSESITNHPTPFSAFKNMSALKYVMAGLEMDERDLEEIIIPDNEGNISECLASNLFWEKDGIYFTPGTETGCVEGIRRAWVIRQLEKDNFTIKTGAFKRKVLMSADSIFSVNVAGITHIIQIDNQTYRQNSWIERLIKL